MKHSFIQVGLLLVLFSLSKLADASEEVKQQRPNGVTDKKLSSLKTAVQEAKLTAIDAAVGDQFGRSVSLSGNRALIGASKDDDNGSSSGSAYVFEYDGSNWVQMSKLTAADGAANDAFGYSVSLSGDRALIGAYFDDDDGSKSGSAYVFDFDGSNWVQTSKLTATDASANDQFGNSLSLSGNRALIGAYFDDHQGKVDSGTAYVFDFDGINWVQTRKLIASDLQNNDRFGKSVSLLGNRALIGASQDDDNGSSSGSAYVFDFDGGNWSQSAKLTADDGMPGDLFGYSISLASDRALIGAYSDDDNGSNSGSAYIFDFDGNNWSQTIKLTATDAEADNRFGISVSLSDDNALIGAYYDNDIGSQSGSAYIFDIDNSNWSQASKLNASDAESGDQFGRSVSLSGTRALIDARLNNDNGSDSGSAYIFNTAQTFNISVSVTGLEATNSIELTTNGQNLNITGFSSPSNFPNPLNDGVAYAVVLIAQPTSPNQTCSISGGNSGSNNGSGTIFGSDVNITVTCATNQYTVSGFVTGLSGGSVTIQNNGADDITLNTDGTFTFPAQNDATNYVVTVSANPSTQTCNIINANGTLSGTNVNNVAITCFTNQYTVGGSVTGLMGGFLTIQNNGANDITLYADGTFTFPAQNDTTSYAVLITTQPTSPNQTCAITSNNAIGNLNGMDETISIECTTIQYNVGVDVSGLANGNSVEFDNIGEGLTVNGDGQFNFTTALDDGSAYDVTVTSQPTSPNQMCSVVLGTGMLNGNDVVITVTCTTNQYFVGGMTSGLANGNSVELTLGAENLTVNNNTAFVFINPLTDESSYTISISSQPTVPNQTCELMNETGTIAGNDVTDIEANCTTNQYTISGTVTGLHAGNNLLIQNNNGDDLLISNDGIFNFATPIEDLQSYNVSILNQPSNPQQPCEVDQNSGNVAGNNVTSVIIICGLADDLIFKEGFE